MNSNDAFDVIEAVAKQSGHSKLSVLNATHPGITRYLLAAYNPYKKYYITANTKGQGTAEFNRVTWGILEGLHNRTLSGGEAKALVSVVLQEMHPKSAELFKRILKKDLRMGLGAKSINKVFPGLIPTHDIMLAKLFDKSRIKFPCFGSPKIDGVRAKFKNGKFYSRNGHIYPGLEFLEKQLSDIRISLDGELTVSGKSFQEGSGLIRRNTPTPNALFHVFDLPEEPISFTQRLTVIRDLHLIGPNIMQVPHDPLNSMDSIASYYQTCRQNGYEGSVIKAYDYKYTGTRSYNWMKMKNVDTADLKIVDVFEGTGKYEGLLGGFVVDFKGVKVKVGSGFSDPQRELYWENKDTVIGQTAEVLYMEITPDGSLRHPRFVRLRTDK